MDKKMRVNLIVHCVLLLACFIACIVVLNMDFSTVYSPDAATEEAAIASTAEMGESLLEINSARDAELSKEKSPFNQETQAAAGDVKSRILTNLEANKSLLVESGVDYDALIASDLNYYAIGDNGYCIPANDNLDVYVYFIDSGDYLTVANQEKRTRPTGKEGGSDIGANVDQIASDLISVTEDNRDLLLAYDVEVDDLIQGIKDDDYVRIEVYDEAGNLGYDVYYDDTMIIRYSIVDDSVEIIYQQ